MKAAHPGGRAEHDVLARQVRACKGRRRIAKVKTRHRRTTRHRPHGNSRLQRIAHRPAGFGILHRVHRQSPPRQRDRRGGERAQHIDHHHGLGHLGRKFQAVQEQAGKAHGRSIATAVDSVTAPPQPDA
jgi:hypothetical protein